MGRYFQGILIKFPHGWTSAQAGARLMGWDSSFFNQKNPTSDNLKLMSSVDQKIMDFLSFCPGHWSLIFPSQKSCLKAEWQLKCTTDQKLQNTSKSVSTWLRSWEISLKVCICAMELALCLTQNLNYFRTWDL